MPPGMEVKMDEFYLPEDVVEWLSLKKSEYLSRLIENMEQGDIPFEEYHRFEELIPATISLPDWNVESIEDNFRIKTYCRGYSDPEVYNQIVIGAIMADQGKNDVFVPIISFVTKFEKLIKLFSGGKIQRPLLN